ncbi:MAG: NUDIX domain-containing protein [Oscillospiraceae bacterium]|nr:NUDIX domain-containing protein [Oscillospiraceae bacterium]
MEAEKQAARVNVHALLGKYVRVRVTHPIGSCFTERGGTYRMNYGDLVALPGTPRPDGVFVMGMNYPIRNFDGRVIALVLCKDGRKFAIAAPKKTRYIIVQIRPAIAFAFDEGTYRLVCLYERSCGAVVFRQTNKEPRFLLIKNNRSTHWGFPKGHVEANETAEQTAHREVLEETGLRVDLIPGFTCQSEYRMQGKVEKTVTIFLGKTEDKTTQIQREEIENYTWLRYHQAMQVLKFENDKNILRKAYFYLKRTQPHKEK